MTEFGYGYSQVVVHVCHVRSIAKRLDERFLRFGRSALLAQDAAQVAVSWKQHTSCLASLRVLLSETPVNYYYAHRAYSYTLSRVLHQTRVEREAI